MKKLFAVLLAASLAFTPVLAQEKEVEVIDWTEYEDLTEEEEYKGEFVSIEDTGLKIFLPSSFDQEELSKEDKENDLVACFTGPGVDEEGNEGVMSVVMSSIPMEGSLEELAEDVEAEDVEWMELNGMPAFAFVDVEDEYPSYVCWVETGDGNAVLVMFLPISSEENATTSLFMLYSLQKDKAEKKVLKGSF